MATGNSVSGGTIAAIVGAAVGAIVSLLFLTVCLIRKKRSTEHRRSPTNLSDDSRKSPALRQFSVELGTGTLSLHDLATHEASLGSHNPALHFPSRPFRIHHRNLSTTSTDSAWQTVTSAGGNTTTTTNAQGGADSKRFSTASGASQRSQYQFDFGVHFDRSTPPQLPPVDFESPRPVVATPPPSYNPSAYRAEPPGSLLRRDGVRPPLPNVVQGYSVATMRA